MYTDKMTMEAIFSLLAYLFYTVFASVFVFFTIRILKGRKSSGIKNNILNIQASISLLRISLKSKIKRKANSFHSRFVKPINAGDPIDLAINELSENKFETGEDFQNYFELSKRINGYISTDVIGVSKELISQEQFEDYMGPDYKNELSIIRVIKEITELTSILNNRIDNYNFINAENKIAKSDPLVFPALIEVNRVFAREFGSEAIAKENFEKIEKAS